MSLSRTFVAIALLALFSLLGCSSNSKGKEFSFERSLQEPVIEKRCVEGRLDTGKGCYLLKWRNPVDTVKLGRVHVWLDTTAVDTATDVVSSAAKASSLKKAFDANSGNEFDSLDISDAVNILNRKDTLEVTLWAEYDDSGTPGRIVRTFVILGDDIAPARVTVTDSGSYQEIDLTWTRPNDHVDFYRPELISGVIKGYNVYLSCADGANIRDAKVKLFIGGIDKTDSMTRGAHWVFAKDTFALMNETNEPATEMHLAFEDGLGFQGDPVKDRIQLILTELRAETRYYIEIRTYDVAGNYSVSEIKPIGTTDSIQPLVASAFVYTKNAANLAEIDSNRVKLTWLSSLDPITPTELTLEEAHKSTAGCAGGPCFRDVRTYQLDVLEDTSWSSLLSTGSSDTVLVKDASGTYIGSSLRWAVPGDSAIVRMRAVDSSGYLSEWLQDTIRFAKSPYESLGCPVGFIPVKRMGLDSSKFCIERYEHATTQGTFDHNVLFQDARATCKGMSTGSLQVDLCSETDWNSACGAGNSTYGTIQQAPFIANEFLINECNLGTGDSLSADSLSKRHKHCMSVDGVHDLPAQLQEWARGTQKRLDTNRTTAKIDTVLDSVAVIKGSSYVAFTLPSDQTLYAKCSARSVPVRVRANYTTDSVFLYKNLTNIDTLLVRDTARKVFSIVTAPQFHDTIYRFEVRHPVTHDSLGIDYVEAKDYKRRVAMQTGSIRYLDVISGGLDYVFLGPEAVFLLNGTRIEKGSEAFYREPSVGFRCCAVPSP